MKTKLFFAILIVCTLNCYSQNWLWTRGTADGAGGGGAGDNRGFSVSADTEGNVFVTGGFQSPTLTFGSITITNAGGGNGYAHDIFIVKYDTNGNVLWAKSIGGTGDDLGFSVSADANGNVFVTGLFRSPTISLGSTILTNTNGSQVFIAKYNANGNVLWAKSVGGSSYNGGNSVSADKSGNVFLTGSFTGSTLIFDSITLTGDGASTIFIAKYDTNGNVLWAKSAGGIYHDEGYSVSADAVGNVFVTGSFQSPTITFDSVVITNFGGSCYSGCYDAFIAKYDANGNILWAKSAGGPNYYDESYSISADAAGNAFVTGLFSSATITLDSITLTNAGVGASDIFIAKYDALGNVLWAKRAGGISGDYCNSISADATGNVFITGWFNNPTITFDWITLSDSNSNNYLFTAKFNANGNVLCASALAGEGVSTDSYGNAYVGGDFLGKSFIIGLDTLTSTGGSNVLVAKFSCNNNGTVEVNELNNEERVSVYPNPSSGIFTIDLKNKTVDAKICIYDVLGNCVFDKMLMKKDDQEIDLSRVSKGIYFVRINSEKESVTRKIIIQ